MSTTVHLPRVLAGHIGQRCVELEAASLADALTELSQRFALDGGLLAGGRVQPWIRLSVDGERICEDRLERLRDVPVAGRRVGLSARIACG